MSPNGQSGGKKITVPDNLYTVILALAFGAVLATAVLVAYKCFMQYDTIFTVPT